SLLFNDNASVVPANTSINIHDANVAVGRLTFNNNSYNYSISTDAGRQIVDGGPFNTGSGTVNIVGSIIMNGAAQLTISTANTFSGGVTLNNGTLNVNDASALGTGPLTVTASSG